MPEQKAAAVEESKSQSSALTEADIDKAVAAALAGAESKHNATLTKLTDDHKQSLDAIASEAKSLREQLTDIRSNALLNFDPSQWLTWLIANRALGQSLYQLLLEFESISQPVTDVTGLKSRIMVALKFAKLIASQVSGEKDSALIDLVGQAITTDGALDLITEVLRKVWKDPTAPGVPNGALAHLADQFSPEQHRTLRARAEQRSINWAGLASLLPTIIQIIQMFTGKGTTTAPVSGN